MDFRSGPLALALILLSPPAALLAQTTWSVDVTIDENDGACVPGDCSLREALAGAASGDTIQFALPGAPPWTIRLATALGQLAVGIAVTIEGPGASQLTISGDSDGDGDGDVRTIDVTASGNLALSDARLELGLAPAGASNRDGGCIRNQGILTLTDVELAGCRGWSGTATTLNGAPGGNGGGIWNVAGATLTIVRGVFSGNVGGGGASSIDGMSMGPPGGSGGAIANAGTAAIRDTTFAANHGGRGGFPFGVGGDGGAIANLSGGNLRVDGSTLAGNFSGDSRCEAFGSARDGRGGGLFSLGESAVNNSTLSGNRTGDAVTCSSQAARGGGLAIADGTVRLRNVTVAGNSSSGNGGGIAREGGTLRLRNSLVAENAGNSTHDDCTTTVDASLVSEGYNTVGVRDGCVNSLTATGDQWGTAAAPLDTGIGALSSNGGPTQTRALDPDSISIDAGDPADCLGWDPVGGVDVALPFDQRGEARETDGDGDLVAVCDSGSYEAAEASPQQHELTVAVAGSGTGSVSSSPPGIACPGDCSESYVFTETVDLTPTADPGSMFTGWSGDCTGSGVCSVEMSADRSVTATFTALRTLTVTLAGDGGGTVESDDLLIDCPGDCSEVYLDGATPTLSATAAPGSIFQGWSGDCSGTGTCPLAMTADRTVNATFLLEQLFADGFESGNVCLWDLGVGAPPC